MKKIMRSAKPRRMWIDGSSFTIAQNNKKGRKQDCLDLEAENYASKYNISKQHDGKYYTSFRLPLMYCTKFNNPNYFSLKQFQTETDTKITIPNSNPEDKITIEATNLDNIIKARNELHSLANDIREKSRPLQFISIPLINDEIKQNFQKFKDDILIMEGIDGMHESIFQSPDKLHLTIVVFSLQDDAEIAEAIKILNDCKEDIINTLKNVGPLMLKVEGIECMNDNITKTNVLFAKPTIISEVEDINLQNIANKIQDAFYEKGLVVHCKDDVKLHCTLINTKYRKNNETKSPSPKKHKWFIKKQPFNATKIIEKYQNFYFGNAAFNKINLSLMSSIDEDGFYKSISSINI